MRKAVVIQPDGEMRVVEIPDPPDELAALKEHLDGGWLEMVTTPEGLSMFLDEEGKLKRLPINDKATVISGLFPRDVIVGPVVLLGQVDRDGDCLGLTRKQLRDLLKRF